VAVLKRVAAQLILGAVIRYVLVGGYGIGTNLVGAYEGFLAWRIFRQIFYWKFK